MTAYGYKCRSCGKLIEAAFPMGEAAPTVPCEDCGSEAARFYGKMNFALKGGGWPRKFRTFNREMTQRNAHAEKRMRIEHVAPKLVDQR